MLISALCDYYDELAKEEKIIPRGFSKQAVHYLIALTSDGEIDSVADYRKKTPYNDKKGNTKYKISLSRWSLARGRRNYLE